LRLKGFIFKPFAVAVGAHQSLSRRRLIYYELFTSIKWLCLATMSVVEIKL
jgi:hypothetical protein